MVELVLLQNNNQKHRQVHAPCCDLHMLFPIWHMLLAQDSYAACRFCHSAGGTWPEQRFMQVNDKDGRQVWLVYLCTIG